MGDVEDKEFFRKVKSVYTWDTSGGIERTRTQVTPDQHSLFLRIRT